MIRFGDISREKDVLGRIIDESARLPHQVFKQTFFSLHVIEFDVLFSMEFFRNVQKLATATGSETLILGVLQPDPEAYYHAHFGVLPFFRLNGSDSPHDYLAALHAAPGGSEADAIAHHSDVVVIYPEPTHWLIYGDRGLEIALVVAITEEAAAAIPLHPPARLFEMNEALAELLPSAFRGGTVPLDIQTALIANYGVPR